MARNSAEDERIINSGGDDRGRKVRVSKLDKMADAEKMSTIPGPERLNVLLEDFMPQDTGHFIDLRQDARGGEARAASKGSEKPRESTAPTDEQIAEALEFLRMFREREQPTNDWEASALDRLEQLVSAAVRTGRGPEAPERPEPAVQSDQKSPV